MKKRKEPLRKLNPEELERMCKVAQIPGFKRAVKIFFIFGIMVILVDFIAYYLLYHVLGSTSKYVPFGFKLVLLFDVVVFFMGGLVSWMVKGFEKMYEWGITDIEEISVEAYYKGEAFGRTGIFLLAQPIIYILNEDGPEFEKGQTVSVEKFSNGAIFSIDGIMVKDSINLAVLGAAQKVAMAAALTR